LDFLVFFLSSLNLSGKSDKTYRLGAPSEYSSRMRSAIGLSVHTGWAVAVVVAGTRKRPQILRQSRIEVLPDPARFCYHRAAEMPRSQVETWLTGRRQAAIGNARRGLAQLLEPDVVVAGIVARDGAPQSLDEMLSSHPRWHSAEAYFYRDVFRAALSIPAHLVVPRSLQPEELGKLAPSPWGRDQKLAALAGWAALSASQATH
jgi:hypothetical protein